MSSYIVFSAGMRFHRVVVFFLVFLLCLNWTLAQEKSGGNDESKLVEESGEQSEINEKRQKNISPDIWTELKELRHMVIKQEVDLSYSKTKIETLERQNTAQTAALLTLEGRLTDTEIENADLLSRITASEHKSTVLESRLNSSETEVEQLKRQNADRPKVAFSFGLTDAGNIGPFNTDITLKFSRVITNFGQAYNPNTGVFTAPIQGIYYFRFSAMNTNLNVWLEVQVYLNGKKILLNSDSDNVGHVLVTNALVLQLKKGDAVYLVLRAGHAIYDDHNNHTTFSGFLIFPV